MQVETVSGSLGADLRMMKVEMEKRGWNPDTF